MKTFRLLFEQSGVFKNVLKSKGFEAFDYDIQNNFNETDFQCDIFEEIEKEYQNIVDGTKTKTIFSEFNSEHDFIIAFFPCTHFSGLNEFQYKLLIAGKRREINQKSITRLLKRNDERKIYFDLFLKFAYIMKTKGISTIIENPASCCGNHSYLELFSPIEIGYKEHDRSKYGDFYKKPTNYFTLNFLMTEQFIMYSPKQKLKNVLGDNGMLQRSLISQEYVENFYKRFLEGKV